MNRKTIQPPRLSNKLRILRVMIFARLDNEPFLIRKHSDPDKVIIRSGGYRPISFFRGPQIGGDAADVRLRNLRSWINYHHNIEIEGPHYHSYFDHVSLSHKDYRVPTYRLGMTSKEILRFPWDRIFPPGALDLSKYKGAMDLLKLMDSETNQLNIYDV